MFYVGAEAAKGGYLLKSIHRYKTEALNEYVIGAWLYMIPGTTLLCKREILNKEPLIFQDISFEIKR